MKLTKNSKKSSSVHCTQHSIDFHIWFSVLNAMQPYLSFRISSSCSSFSFASNASNRNHAINATKRNVPHKVKIGQVVNGIFCIENWFTKSCPVDKWFSLTLSASCIFFQLFQGSCPSPPDPLAATPGNIVDSLAWIWRVRDWGVGTPDGSFIPFHHLWPRRRRPI